MLSKKALHAAQVVTVLATLGLVLLRNAHASSIVSAPVVIQDVARGLCYHTDPSDWTCPDSSLRLFTDASAIAKATITIVDRSGKSKTVDLPAGTDAVFLSKNAVRNFLIRYYRDTEQTKKRRALTDYVTSHSR